MKTKELKQLFFLVILIGLGLIYLYVNYLFIPQRSNIEQLKEKIAERTSHLELLQSYERNPTALKNELETLQMEYSNLKDQIPDKIDKPEIVASLYNEAKLNEVQPLTVAFGTLETREGYMVQPIVFNCIGQAENVFQMINALQDDQTFQFSVESANFAKEGGLLHGQISFFAYASNSN